MRKFIFVFVSFCLLSKIEAFDASPSCFRDLERNFFQESFVHQAFSIHGLDQSVWVPILQNVQAASKDLPKMIRQKAKNLNPDPFDPVFIPDVAFQLLDEALFQIFVNAITVYNPNQVLRVNNNDIWDMFLYIRNQQMQKIERCFN